MRIRHSCVYLAFLLIAAACTVREAAAQTIRGRVLVGTTVAPLASAIVQALSPDGTVAGSALSNETGFFAITPVADGVYSIRILRIGFRPFVAPSVTVANGESEQMVIAWEGESFALQTRVVTSNRTCRISADSGSLVANVWDEARKAMLSAVLAERGDAPLIARTNYSRTVSLDDEVVTSQQMSNEARHTFRAYTSWAPESLAARGYHNETTLGGRTVAVYRSPDATTLTSESFAGTHCFSLVKGSGANANDIGVAFTPAAKSNVRVDIEGTFWIDRNTSHLRYVEFTYVGLPSYAKNARSGGRVEFTTLRNGLWLLSNWRIRMPHVGVQRINGLEVQGLKLQAVDETGGMVNSVSSGDTTLFEQSLPSISMYMKSTGTNLARAGVKIGIVGTELIGTTNADGRVIFRNIVPGRYNFRASFPALAMFGEVESSKTVLVNAGGMADSLNAPDLRPLLKSSCGDAAQKKETVILFGTVRDTATFALGGGDGAVTVRAESGDSAASFAPVRGSLIDLRGQFLVCSAPRGNAIVEVQNSVGTFATRISVPQATPVFELPVVVAPPSANPTPQSAVATSQLAYLEIRVTDYDLIPVSKRRVEVTSADGRKVNAYTDTFGRALFLNLRPGQVTIDVGDDTDTVSELKIGRNFSLISIAEPVPPGPR